MNDEKTYRREINALIRAMKEFKMSSGLILTENTYEDKTIDGFFIQLRPLCLWLLMESFE